MKRIISCLISLCVLCGFSACSQSQTRSTQSVEDRAGLYDPAQKHSIDSLITDFEQKEKTWIALITIDSAMIPAALLDSFTLEFGRRSSAHHQLEDNGIAVGISKDYRAMRIENGFTAARLLTNEETKKIIGDHFIPNFKIGKYYEGTIDGLTELMRTLSDKLKLKN